jgi:8-oxo-dGTP diphosphatase
MFKKCNQCKKRHLEPFGHCPIYLKVQEASKLLTDIPVTFNNLQFSCNFFESFPVLGAVSVIVVRDGSFLLGKRTNSYGDDTWGLPGGEIDFGENWFNAAQREVLEETGLLTENFKFHGLTNDLFADEKKHFINAIISCRTADDSVARVVEPLKCKKWVWMTCDELVNFKEPLFLSLENVMAVIDIEKICKD